MFRRILAGAFLLLALSLPAAATVNTQANATIVSGNGSQTVFDFSFIGVAAQYITVTFTDASGDQTVLSQGTGTTQYQITLNAPVQGAIWGVGGTVTYNPGGTPIPAGSTLTIVRTLPLTQAITLQNQSSVQTLGKGAETAVDTAVMQDQQINEQLGRAVKGQPGETLNLLPQASSRIGKVLSFDSNGQPTVTPQVTNIPAATPSIGTTAACNGSTDDAAAINSSITTANSIGGGTVVLPSGVCAVGSPVVLLSNVVLAGQGVGATTIKLKNGADVDVLDGLNANSLFGSGSNAGISYAGISDLTIDGNSSNNLTGTGSCVAIYGFRFSLINMRIQNCASHGLRTEYGGTSLPLESNFLNVLIENTQQHGWLFAGPHDSNVDFVYVVDCCQAANNTWDGFNLTAPVGNASANMHARHLHAYHTSGAITNRMRFAWNDAGGGGNNISDSNFEGANVPGFINSSNNTLINNAWYAAWGGTSTLIVKQSLNTIVGFIGQPGAGRGAVSGIVLGQGSDNAASNVIDMTVGTQNLGSIDFTHSAGSNTVRIRGFQTTGPGFISFPGQFDSVDLNITGTPTSLSHLLQMPGKISTGIGTAGPTLSGCGTSPTVTGSDTAGIIGTGGGATACTLTFNSAWTNVPFCLVTAQSGTAPGYSRTATQLILSVATAGNFYHYLCIGPPGG